MQEQRMAWENIKEKYPDQWVSLNDVDKDEDGKIRSAIVVASGLDLKELTLKLKKRNSIVDSFEYTGQVKQFLGFARWEIEEVKNAPQIS